MGGKGIIVEADETVLCRRGVINNPTSTNDNIAYTVWILGVIDNTPQKILFITKVPNRRIDTLSQILEGIIATGSSFYTDGYPSYPGVSNNLHLEHIVVNHNAGFISFDRTHTNNIESFWPHLKTSMRKENSVMRHNIDEWIAEYTFKRRYLINASIEDISRYYIELLKYFFN